MPEPEKNREDYLNDLASGAKPQPAKALTTIEKISEKAEAFTDHLQELRNRILITVISLITMIMLCFYFSGPIILFLEAAAPEGASFFQLKPGELFMSSFKVSVYLGVILALPVFLNQIAVFLSPGLNQKEKKILSPIFWASPFLFLAGIAFAYYMVLPPLLDFLLGFREGVVETRYGLEHFINLELSILALCGIAFQLPIIIITISFFNIIKSSQLMSIWRYVILGSFVIAAVLTPTPDPLTMTIVALALLALYFGTVTILIFMKK